MPRVKHDQDVLRGLARGPWALLWADAQEEEGVRFPGGTDLYEEAPETPRWAQKWARNLADSIVALNGASLAELYAAAKAAGYQKNEETFGYHLGMEATGAGVHWTDDVRRGSDLEVKVPDYEFYEGAERHAPDTRFVSH